MAPQTKSQGRAFLAILAAGMVVFASLTGSRMLAATAEQESPYRVSEFPVRVTSGLQSNVVVSGKWVVWQDAYPEASRITGRNTETGVDFSIPMAGGESLQWPVDVEGDTIVAVASRFENRSPEYGVFGFKLPDGQRFEIRPFKPAPGPIYSAPRTDGKTVVWVEGSNDKLDIIGYDLVAQRPITVSTQPNRQQSPAVSGSVVVWLDDRHAPGAAEQDIYVYDLSTNQEIRVTSQTGAVGSPAVSGNMIVWSAYRQGSYLLEGFDLANKQRFAITGVVQSGLPKVDMDGDLVVWAAQGVMDSDVFGYDLKQGKQFIISRAIGGQNSSRISGKTIVWVDSRHGGAGKYDYDSDIYGARLEPGPAPIPPVIGAPGSADAKIEIVWPHGGTPVADADQANIGAWLFISDTLKLAPCQWSPKVQLWKAVNSEPAKMVASGQKSAGQFFVKGQAIPTWYFNDVDVAAARDPQSRVYFFVTLEGMPYRTNVWAHAVDARTYFPKQDVPVGVAPVGGAVEAKIEIVWPHEDARVEQAKRANISASIFSPGTLMSVPADWNPTVRLYRSLNSEVGRAVAVGQKRLVQASGFSYPVWDFNDIDVSAANDPVNKYYFTVSVDGVNTYTNVWSHGADARTYFPQVDTPTQDCRATGS